MNRIFNPQGIREAPCFDRRERSLQRHTNIENLSDFDYRSPLPLTKDVFPTTKSTDTYRTDLMNLSMTPDESLNKAVYHETLRSSIASTSKRNRNIRSHYGPSYYRRGYGHSWEPFPQDRRLECLNFQDLQESLTPLLSHPTYLQGQRRRMSTLFANKQR